MVDANPFVKGGAAVESLHVACLARTPDQPIAGILDPEAVLPDEFVLAGADVYLRFPNGVGKSLISNARLDKAFGTVSTLRNCRTAVRLLELLEAPS